MLPGIQPGLTVVLTWKSSIPPPIAVSDVYFTFRVAASTSTGSFRIVTGGTDCDDFTTDLSGKVEVPATGGNLRYQDLAV